MDLLFQFFSPVILSLQATAQAVLHYPIIYALLLGLIGAFAPCQLTSNISLFTLYTSEGLQNRFPVRSLFLFSLGKLTVYISLILLVVLFGQSFQSELTTFFPYFSLLMGPLWIATGIFLIQPSLFSRSFARVQQFFLPQHNKQSAFVYGVFIALAFCPTMFSIFFLSFVPYILSSYTTLVLSFSIISLPIFFTLGTLLPLLLVLSLLLFLPEKKGVLRSSKKWGSRISKSAGVLLILLGLQQLFTYAF